MTAAAELLDKTNIVPIVFESTDQIGGISQTVNYKGNRMDIGGHRFFSKSKEVNDFWHKIMPSDKDMLTRNRLSRIYAGRKFYDYPVSLSVNTVKNLGLMKMIKIGGSYLVTKIHKKPEDNLEGFYINRFGGELYRTFFRDYTEKLWGIPPREIDSSWGAQRVKGLSITAVLVDAGKKILGIKGGKVETSLIEKFKYPKYGPGYFWEKTAEYVEENGGQVVKNTEVIEIIIKGNKAIGVKIRNSKTGEIEECRGDFVLSTMPISELVPSLKGIEVPKNINKIATELPFRDFITVGVLADKSKVDDLKDNWVYLQDGGVRAVRFQVFSNWSPYLVKNPKDTWIGVEYVVSEKDKIWSWSDERMAQFAVDELEKVGIIDNDDVRDTTVVRMKKAYPAYFGSYKDFSKVRKFLDKNIENLWLLGRNGQHRYNNMDHSMLTAMRAVEAIKAGKTDKSQVWSVNTEEEYHESTNGKN